MSDIEDKKVSNSDINRMILHIHELDEKEKHIPKYNLEFLNYRFNLCMEYLSNNNIPVGNTTVYTWLRLSNDDVYNVLSGRVKSVDDDVLELLRSIKRACALNREAQMNVGLINPVVGIFHQKAHDGLTDQPQTVVLPVAVAPVLNQTELLKQYGIDALNPPKSKGF